MEDTGLMNDIEMNVVETSDLPEKFQPPERNDVGLRELPGPLADLVEEATSGLTDAERGAFLSRLHREKPEVFRNGGTSGEDKGAAEGGEDLPREEWKKQLATWLKEEANRFMAAAAKL